MWYEFQCGLAGIAVGLLLPSAVSRIRVRRCWGKLRWGRTFEAEVSLEQDEPQSIGGSPDVCL
jgi:hypothetical protein